MAINDGNRPIVDDSTIFGKDASIETGRTTNIPKGNKGEEGSKEETERKKKEAEEIAKEGLEGQKISQSDHRR